MAPLSTRCIAEALGIFLLTFFGIGAIVHMGAMKAAPGADLLVIAFAHGIALAIGVSATMNVSGGHLNPAVTIAMLTIGRIKPVEAAAYIVAQLIGATAAAASIQMVLGFSPTAAAAFGNLGTPQPAEGVSAAGVVITEIILTAVLLFAIFGTAVDKRAPALGGFGIGLAVFIDILAGGPVSGAAMNPGRAFGPALVSGTWNLHWAYWVGPVLGAVLMANLYQYVVLPAEEPAKE